MGVISERIPSQRATNTPGHLEWWRRPGDDSRCRLLALLPVYNRADTLSESLKALHPAVDGILALDDGSTDETPRILRADPRVLGVISKAPRPTPVDWNDAENRKILYEAADFHDPEWVLCIDADEVLEGTFATYREILLSQGSHVKAYAFPLVAIHDKKITGAAFVQRMYRYRRGYHFDSRRLHCRLIPLDIMDEEMWTANIRIFHQSASPSQKENRYRKYKIADPTCQFLHSYEGLLRTNPTRPIMPIGGCVELKPFVDNMLDAPRYFASVEPNDERLAPWLGYLQGQLSEALPILREFHQARLDFFYVSPSATRETWRLQHRFEEAKSVNVSAKVAWLVENYRIKKDFFLLAAGLAATFDIGPERCLGEMREAIAWMKRAGILV